MFESGSQEAAHALEVVMEAEAERLRPCVIHRAQLRQIDLDVSPPNAWAAMLGGLIVAGRTPEDAMRNFDQAFRGLPCAKTIKTPGEREGTWTYPKCVLAPGHSRGCEPPAGDSEAKS